MKTSNDSMGDMQRNIEKNQRILNNLFTKGVIDEDGNIINAKRAPAKMTD